MRRDVEWKKGPSETESCQSYNSGRPLCPKRPGGLASAAGKSGRDAATRLADAGRAYVEFAASNPAHFRVMFRPELVSLDNYPSARAEARRAFTALEALVAVAVKDKVIAPGLANGTVLLAWAFVQGLSWLSKNARKDGGRRPNSGRLSRIRAPRLQESPRRSEEGEKARTLKSAG